MRLSGIQHLISAYQLLPHPEGGFYRETYRSPLTLSQSALPEDFSGDRQTSTAIYFLLTPDAKSHLHRIASDEIWHFYSGDPITVVELTPDGELKQTVLGQDPEAGQHFQYVVPAGNWFGAFLNPGGEYGFVGCTVSPGFDFADFDLATRESLLSLYPKAADIITFLTPAS